MVEQLSDNVRVLVERIGAKLFERNLSEREASLDATGKPDALRYIRTRNSMPSAARLERIAATLGTTSEWLLGGNEDGASIDAGQGVPTQLERIVEGKLPKTLPVFGTALAADLELLAEDGHPVAIEQVEVNMAEPLDRMQRPTAIAGKDHFYVVTVWGESMVPRFDSGSRKLVDMKRLPRVGDDVVVQLRSPIDDSEEVTAVLIKQVVRHKAGRIVLRQFNPPVIFEVPNEKIKHIHVIVPWDDVLSL